ncbi:MAG: DUF1287 domain-containing protein [Emcibacter sp.]|nr:DUF1287 domain-containing protein [Emcibacter sp.]
MGPVHWVFSIIFILSTTNAQAGSISDKLVTAALERTKTYVIYNGSYKKISYPMGDINPHLGVCTDVIIRIFRNIDFDFQQAIHEDMLENFTAYPEIWGLRSPDSNIDHRRVPNIRTFLDRKGASLPVTHIAANYKAGDLVTWMLPGNKPHIGIIIKEKDKNKIPLIVHNIGLDPLKGNILFKYPITGHYRYLPN